MYEIPPSAPGPRVKRKDKKKKTGSRVFSLDLYLLVKIDTLPIYIHTVGSYVRYSSHHHPRNTPPLPVQERKDCEL